MAEPVELVRHRQPRRAGADHGDAAVAAQLGRIGRYPALLEAARDDRELDLLDRDRVVVDVEDAGRLAGRRADQAGELGEVVGGVQLDERVAPLIAVDEVVPVWDQVAERAALVAEGHAAVHAARALIAQHALVGQAEVLPVVVHALVWVALLEADPLEAKEAAELSHQRPLFAGAAALAGTVEASGAAAA
jgi:hypothetical protein